MNGATYEVEATTSSPTKSNRNMMGASHHFLRSITYLMRSSRNSICAILLLNIVPLPGHQCLFHRKF